MQTYSNCTLNSNQVFHGIFPSQIYFFIHPQPFQKIDQDAREQCAEDTGNEQDDKRSSLRILHSLCRRRSPAEGFRYLWNEGERARQLFLASSSDMKWRRDSLIAKDMERHLAAAGESKVHVDLMVFLNCFSAVLF